jgi:cytochrome c oxidase subunit 2
MDHSERVTDIVPPVPLPPTRDRSSVLRRRAVPVAALAMLVLAGCAQDAPQDTWKPKGPDANRIQNLQWPVFLTAGIVGLIVFAAIAYATFRFRDRGQAMPEQTHGKPALEIALTILPALILVGVGIPTVSTIFKLAKTNDAECIINVTGQQWWWEYDYPVQDGCGGISAPIVTSGQLVIPTETTVILRLTSRDVIHSYWIPMLNGKRDTVPGRVHTLRMEADKPGMYAGQCTEFCGLSHANMRQEAVALTAPDFETWKSNQLEEYQAPEEGTDLAAAEQTFIANCSYCHQVNGLTTTAPDGTSTPVLANPDEFIVAGAAPNLTNLMTRTTFAGSTFDLLTAGCRGDRFEIPPEEFGAYYLKGVTPECLNQVDLRAWLRNAPGMKPMYVETEGSPGAGGKIRGMPNLNLSEDQIDQLITYLLERK